MTVSKRTKTLWHVIIVVWAIANVIVPGGLVLSIAVGAWLAWNRSPYLRFFVITMLVAMLATAATGMGGYVVFHR